MGIYNMYKALKKLNPNGNFELYDNYIVGNIEIFALNLPKGYYYNDKNSITNKHNTPDGVYECIYYLYQ